MLKRWRGGESYKIVLGKQSTDGLAVLIIFKANMMHKWLKTGRNGEPAEFGPAAIANDDCLDLTEDEPIDPGKDRQTQAVSFRHEQNPDQQDQTAQKLIKIFLDI